MYADSALLKQFGNPMDKVHIGNRIDCYTLYPGEHYAAADPAVLATVTGPCLVVCLYDPERKIGGMGHFFIPGIMRVSSPGSDDAWNKGTGEMELVIGEIVKLGGDRKRLQASVFGASLLPVDGLPGFDDMLMSNMHFIRDYFQRESIPIVADGLGGITYKRIDFHTDTGAVRSAVVTDTGEQSDSRRREQEYLLSAASKKSPYGKVVLYDTASFETLVGLIPDIVYRIDQDGIFRYVSDSIFKLGYEPEELIGKHYSTIIHPDYLVQVQRTIVLPKSSGTAMGPDSAPKLFDERRTGRRITRNLKVKLIPGKRAGDTEKFPMGEVICTGQYDIKSEGKNFQGTIGIIRDISDIISAQRALEMTERFYRTMLNGSSDIFSMLFTDGTILFTSEAAFRTTGMTCDDLVGENLCDYTHPDDLTQTRMILDAPAGMFYSNLVEHRFRHADGRWIIFESTIYKILDNEKSTIINILHSRDITQRKQVEERLKAALEDKELLLKEVHHRVKNNLQIIVSLLELQSKQIKDENVQAYFQESQNRIRAIALIHEKLYGSSDFTRIGFDKYLHSLMDELFRLYGEEGGKIKLAIKADPVEMIIGMAIPCGIIINEIVTNSMKYAFPASFTGEPGIAITMKEDSGGRVTLIVQDNGVGIPDHIDPDTSETLGLLLIKILSTGQLKGTCDISHGDGTRITVSFQNR